MPSSPTLTPAQRTRVERAARAIHATLPLTDLVAIDGPDLGDLLATPIDVHGIAASLGIHVIELPGLSGRLLRVRDGRELSGLLDLERFRVYLEARHSPQRRRFTLAHELGHHLLGHSGALAPSGGAVHADEPAPGGAVASRSTDERVRCAELEANLFASLLLVPRLELDVAVATHGTSVARIARDFDISAPAARLHLAPYMPVRLERERAA